MPTPEPCLLAIDAGKTTLRLAVFSPECQQLTPTLTLSSADPAHASPLLTDHLQQFARDHPLVALGLSTFGPLDTAPRSPSFGAIVSSSDPVWSGINLPALLHHATRLPVFFDYDTNAGALAEQQLGYARGLDRFLYLSVGTGIGGALVAGSVRFGHSPLLGHIPLPREPDDLSFPGSCRFHGTCLQGLASGRALAERWGAPAELLPPNHLAWDLEARYLARACTAFIYTLLPTRILLASSVAAAPGLVDHVNQYTAAFLDGFLDPATAALYAASAPVTLAQFTPHSSLLGAALLARDRLGLRFG